MALAANKQNVEIYFNEEDRSGIFGFKINNIDSEELLNDNIKLWGMIEPEINNAFLLSGLVEKGEGDTTYTLLPDLTCLKTAKYFSWVDETEQFWIENNLPEFYFKDIIFPTNGILISKNTDSNSISISEKGNLKKTLTKEQFKVLNNYLEALTKDFENIELRLMYDEDNDEAWSISEVDGFYQQQMEFSLLDSSNIEIPLNDLKSMLLNCFKIKPSIVEQILKKK